MIYSNRFPKITIVPVLFICFLLCFSACKNSTSTASEKDVSDHHLGKVELKVTGAPGAQAHFEKGLLLLHSFEYFDARAAFLKAQEIDPQFAMAYWGEAMAYNHSLWQRQLTERAYQCLNRFGANKEERLKKVHTEIERDLFTAVEILYGEGTKYERDIAYRDFMATLAEKYPENHEVAAFYAISLIGSAQNGRDEELFDQSAKIAQGILKENANHPGALHYLIHSYDDPDHAHLAKDAADSYSKVAPDAAHALHMPSHIYVALGKWDDVVTSNIASWNASMKKKSRNEGLEGSYHALNWLQYGLLQRGEVQLAEQMMDKMIKYSNEAPTKVARAYLLAMKGADMVERKKWSGEIADIEVKVDDLSITKRAGSIFLDAMKAYYKKDVDTMKGLITQMKKDKYAASLDVGDQGFSMCSTDGFASKPPSQLDIDMVTIMEMELDAYMAKLNGDEAQTLKLLRDASLMDETLNYAFGPPTILKPAHEAYAEELFYQGKYEEALKIYDASLERHPRRLLSLSGKKRAIEQLQKAELMAEINKELETSLKSYKREEIL